MLNSLQFFEFVEKKKLFACFSDRSKTTEKNIRVMKVNLKLMHFFELLEIS